MPEQDTIGGLLSGAARFAWSHPGIAATFVIAWVIKSVLEDRFDAWANRWLERWGIPQTGRNHVVRFLAHPVGIPAVVIASVLLATYLKGAGATVALGWSTDSVLILCVTGLLLLFVGVPATLSWVRKPVTGRLSEQQEERLLPAEASRTAEAQPAKIWVEEGVVALTQMYRDHTAAQADQLATAYIGKWMRVDGEVVNVQRRGSYYAVRLQRANEERWAHLHFPADRGAAVSHLGKGQSFRASGRLEQISDSWIILGDCETVSESAPSNPKTEASEAPAARLDTSPLVVVALTDPRRADLQECFGSFLAEISKNEAAPSEPTGDTRIFRVESRCLSQLIELAARLRLDAEAPQLMAALRQLRRESYSTEMGPWIFAEAFDGQYLRAAERARTLAAEYLARFGVSLQQHLSEIEDARRRRAESGEGASESSAAAKTGSASLLAQPSLYVQAYWDRRLITDKPLSAITTGDRDDAPGVLLLSIGNFPLDMRDNSLVQCIAQKVSVRVAWSGESPGYPLNLSIGWLDPSSRNTRLMRSLDFSPIEIAPGTKDDREFAIALQYKESVRCVFPLTNGSCEADRWLLTQYAVLGSCITFTVQVRHSTGLHQQTFELYVDDQCDDHFGIREPNMRLPIS